MSLDRHDGEEAVPCIELFLINKFNLLTHLFIICFSFFFNIFIEDLKLRIIMP